MSWWVNQPYAQSVQYDSFWKAIKVSRALRDSTVSKKPRSITAEQFLELQNILGSTEKYTRSDDARALEEVSVGD